MDILLWATGIASAFMICASAVYKLSDGPVTALAMEHLDIDQSGRRGIGGIELASGLTIFGQRHDAYCAHDILCALGWAECDGDKPSSCGGAYTRKATVFTIFDDLWGPCDDHYFFRIKSPNFIIGPHFT